MLSTTVSPICNYLRGNFFFVFQLFTQIFMSFRLIVPLTKNESSKKKLKIQDIGNLNNLIPGAESNSTYECDRKGTII